MSTYDEFCLHYNLVADSPDSQLQYQQYQHAYKTLIATVGGAS